MTMKKSGGKVAITAILLMFLWEQFFLTMMVDGLTFTPTSMALTIKFTHHVSSRRHPSYPSKSALSYRSDVNVDEHIVSLVESIYKNTNHVMKNDDTTERNTRTAQQKKSYMLLIGVEEAPKAHPPLLPQQYRSSMTLMSNEGMMERHRPENGFQPYSVPTSKASLPSTVEATKSINNQRISIFEGGDPFFSLTNLDYGVATEVINDAAMTGLHVALAVILSTTMHPIDLFNSYDFSFENSVQHMNVMLSLVLSVPAVTAYLSITRSTVGTFTRTMSTFWINLIRLLIVSTTQATTVMANGSSFINDIVSGAATADSTADDAGIVPTIAEPTMICQENQSLERAEPLAPIPVLMGELVWYSSLAVVRQAKNIISKTTDVILNYQVDMIRTNRLQIQEGKQRKLLEAQIYYSNSKNKKQGRSLTKQNDPVILSDLDDSVSDVMTRGNVILPQSEHVFRLGVDERDDVLISSATLQLHGTIDSWNRNDIIRFADADNVGLLQENVFRLGANEREDLLIPGSSTTHQLLGNIESHNGNGVTIHDDEIENVGLLQENVFRLGWNEREDMLISSKTHQLIGNIESRYGNGVTIHDDEIENVGLLQENVFRLGGNEREDRLISSKTHQLFGNIDSQLTQNGNIVADSEDVEVVATPQLPVEHLFLLGKLNRDDLNIATETHHLLGNVDNETQYIAVFDDEGTVVNQTNHLFYLGHDIRDDMMDSTETIHLQLVGNIECYQKSTLIIAGERSNNIDRCLDQEEEEAQIAKVHSLIQERARSETKKRLYRLAESKASLAGEMNEVREQIKTASEVVEHASLQALKLKRSSKSLSHKAGKVRIYLTEPSKKSCLDQYTMVQRVALHLVAATNPLFVSYRKPYGANDGTEANMCMH